MSCLCTDCVTQRQVKTNDRLMKRLNQLVNENRQLKKSKHHLRFMAGVREMKIENLRTTLVKRGIMVDQMKKLLEV